MVYHDRAPTTSEVNAALLDVETALAGIEASYSVDSRLSDAFRASSLYHIAPGDDPSVNVKSDLLVARLKVDSLAFADDAASHVARGTFGPRDAGLLPRAERRDLNQWSVHDWVDSASPVWVDNMVLTEERGLARSNLLGYLRGWLEICYQIPEQQRVDATSEPTNVFERLLSHVVKRDRITTKDFPQSRLDARVTNFFDLAQFEMAALFLSDTYNLGCMGKQGRQAAQQLSRTYLPTAFSYDLAQKRQMMQDVAVRFGQLKTHVHGANNKEVIDIMSSRSRNVATSLDSMMEFFRVVYSNLGYELPGILRDPEPVADAEVVTVTVGSIVLAETSDLEQTVVAKVEEVTADPALLAEMTSRSGALAESARAFAADWSLSNKQHKPYAELTHQMELGFVADVGRRLPPLANARNVVETIVHLHRISQDREGPAAAAERLARAIERQHELQAANRELRRWGSENGIPYSGTNFPSARDVEGLVRTVRNDWIHIAQAIRRYWPHDQVAGVTGSLERLFAAHDQRLAAATEVENI